MVSFSDMILFVTMIVNIIALCYKVFKKNNFSKNIFIHKKYRPTFPEM